MVRIADDPTAAGTERYGDIDPGGAGCCWPTNRNSSKLKPRNCFGSFSYERPANRLAYVLDFLACGVVGGTDGVVTEF